MTYSEKVCRQFARRVALRRIVWRALRTALAAVAGLAASVVVIGYIWVVLTTPPAKSFDAPFTRTSSWCGTDTGPCP